MEAGVHFFIFIHFFFFRRVSNAGVVDLQSLVEWYPAASLREKMAPTVFGIPVSGSLREDRPSATARHRNDVDLTTMSIIRRFRCCFRLESGPEIDMLLKFDVESTSFRCRRIFLSHWVVHSP